MWGENSCALGVGLTRGGAGGGARRSRVRSSRSIRLVLIGSALFLQACDNGMNELPVAGQGAGQRGPGGIPLEPGGVAGNQVEVAGTDAGMDLATMPARSPAVVRTNGVVGSRVTGLSNGGSGATGVTHTTTVVRTGSSWTSLFSRSSSVRSSPSVTVTPSHVSTPAAAHSSSASHTVTGGFGSSAAAHSSSVGHSSSSGHASAGS